MQHLYHGSGYRHTELKPGIHYTGKKVTWDTTESNEWLYATTCMEEAIAQGFASVVEKHYTLNRFQSHGRNLTLVVDGPPPKLEDLQHLAVYLYTLDWLDADNWIKVNNLHNGMQTEYKTQSVLTKAIDRCEQVDLKTWLSRKTVKIVSKRAALNW